MAYSSSRLEATTYAILRILVGIFFTLHGLQKLFGIGGPSMPVGSQLWIGGIIELVGGVLVGLGLFTRCAAFVCSGLMAVAYFQFHWKLHFANYAFLPTVNHGELAVVYCFLFLVFAAHGAGIASLDSRR